MQKVILEIKPIDQIPPLDRLPVTDFKKSDDKLTSDKKRPGTINNATIPVKCESGNCLPPPPICQGCGVIPPTFINGSPSDTTAPVNRPKTPVRININKN